MIAILIAAAVTPPADAEIVVRQVSPEVVRPSVTTLDAAEFLKATPGALTGKARVGAELAQTLYSETFLHDLVSKPLRAVLPTMLEAQPEIAAAEKQYPGLSAKLADALNSGFNDILNSALKKAWRERGALYAAQLSDSEMREALTFYRGSVAGHAFGLVGRNVDLTDALKKAINADDDADFSDVVTPLIKRSEAMLSSEMTEEEFSSWKGFNQSPVGMKLAAMKAGFGDFPQLDLDPDSEEFESMMAAKVTPLIASYEQMKAGK